MGKDSSIQWTNHTFNPWTGCTKVSPGCSNCYAEDLRKRMGKDEWGVGKPRTRTSPGNWRKPLAWDRAAAKAGKRHRVFCASLADWLDPEVPIEWLADLLWLIAATPNLDWLLLTKRPELWRDRMTAAKAAARWSGSDSPAFVLASDWLDGRAPPSVWVGTTVEDQRRADERIPELLSIPARVRFLSCEPLIEAVLLTWPEIGEWPQERRTHALPNPEEWDDWKYWSAKGVNWVIIGGESGPRARPFNLAWARSIVGQCKAAGVAVFVKQLGKRPVASEEHEHEWHGLLDPPHAGQEFRTADSHGGDPSEWPADLRVREFPTVDGV